MPTYCDADDIANITGSGDSGREAAGCPLSTTIVNALIDQAEGFIEGLLAKANATGSASSAILKTATIDLTIAYLAKRLRMSNRKVNSRTMGEITLQDNIDAIIAEAKESAREAVELYARSSLGDPWAESSADAEATVVRQDHAMGSYQLDQSTVKEYHDRADEYGVQDDEEVS